MKGDDFTPLAVRLAREVLDMHHELQELRAEVAELREYRQKYIEELDRSINHSNQMIGGLLSLAMKPGVLDAIGKANEAEAAS